MKTTVINLIAEPGAGKSTIASELFAKMKWAGKNVELVSEYAKELVWEERNETFKDELYIFAKQNHRMFRLNGKVEYIITDRPLILSIFYNWNYGDLPESFTSLVISEIRKFDNINFFLKRIKSYDELGRNQTEKEAVKMHGDIKQMLDRIIRHDYDEIICKEKDTSDYIFNCIFQKIQKDKENEFEL